MRRKISLWLLATILLVNPSFAHAQQPTKVSRIGLLYAGTPESPARRVEAFRQDLRELGYVEGNNIIFEYRFAEGKADSLLDLAAELVRLKVEVIVTSGGPASHAAKKATTMIPIVMAGVGDPVRLGLVESLARSGWNITGITDLGPELIGIGKRLEVLKETIPRVSRVVFLLNAAAGSRQIMLADAEAVAQNLGFKLQAIEVQGPNPDFDDAFRAATKERVGAVITSPHPYIASHRRTSSEEAIADNASYRSLDRGWWPDVIRDGLPSLVPACRHLRRQDPERYQASGPAGTTADKI